MKIYSLGSLNVDYVYSVDHFVMAGETLASDNMSVFPGGKGLNQSVALARAGASVLHGAVVGKEGDFLINTMADSGVDISRIKISDQSCGHAIIQVAPNGQNCILLYAGTNHLVDKNYAEEFLCDAKPGDVLLLQNEISGLIDIFEIAHSKKMQIVFNPSPFSSEINKLPLSYVKWWFCNEIEGEALFGHSEPEKILENFLKKYPDSNLILTLGKNGSVFINSEKCVWQSIYDTNVVDTTAAGDTFTGYFISMLTRGETIERALDIATKASSITVSRKGASESIPFISEL